MPITYPDLTTSQLTVLKEYLKHKEGKVPSFREIGKRLKKDPTVVFYHVKNLEKLGYLERRKGFWNVVLSDKAYPKKK